MMGLKKVTITLICIEIFLLISIILKSKLIASELEVLFDLRFGIFLSLLFQFICFAIIGLILGLQVLKIISSKKIFKVLFIIFCGILILVFLLYFYLKLSFGNYSNSSEFTKINIPNSDITAILNTDGRVSAWIGKSTGLVCYVQVNKFFLKEIQAYNLTRGFSLEARDWRLWEEITIAYKNGNYRWEDYSLIIDLNDLDKNVIKYDFSDYIK